MKIVRMLVPVAAVFILANWGSEESSVEGRKKPSVNFYGTITAVDTNKEYKVEDIMISWDYKQIEMYDMPSAKNSATHTLENDPTQGIKTFINLSEVSEIQAPEPKTIWTYQKDKNDRLAKYTEITVISKGSPTTKNSYLIGADKKIICWEVNASAKSIDKKEIPLSQLKSLKIEGFEHRDGGRPKDCPEKK